MAQVYQALARRLRVVRAVTGYVTAFTITNRTQGSSTSK